MASEYRFSETSAPEDWKEWVAWLKPAIHSRTQWRLPLVLLALDDSPTARYGSKVEGAGLHHNPTSGPDDHKFLFGHVWVRLALVLRHPLWGTVGLPLRADVCQEEGHVQAREALQLGTWSATCWTCRSRLGHRGPRNSTNSQEKRRLKRYR